MNVKSFKDISGREFIGELVSDNEKAVLVKNPMALVTTQDGLVPIPYIMSGKENGQFEIDKSKLIIGPCDVNENIERSYRGMFGGIIEPPQKDLIL
jgi:hypothetical protein